MRPVWPRGSYCNNQFYKKNHASFWKYVEVYVFSCKWRGVGKKRRKRRKGLWGNFALELFVRISFPCPWVWASRSTISIPFSLISLSKNFVCLSVYLKRIHHTTNCTKTANLNWLSSCGLFNQFFFLLFFFWFESVQR